ncbi:MAG: hypothetical protein MSC30_17205 [Gaiellaceae bacterium MAG52_C11]|nr:hypothetical protein [Candidatus Gaiellasilicea maunaloa]
MKIRKIAALFALGGTMVVAGVALATPSIGLKPELLARGAVVDPQDRRDLAFSLLLGSAHESDVAIVKATLEPGGTTGWHSHPEGSMVILKSGVLTVTKTNRGAEIFRRSGCFVDIYDATTSGKAFYHTAGPHTFVNTGTTLVEFYVAYFAPRSAPLLADEPVVPRACS